MTHFGPTVRAIRERLRRSDRRYSVRQVAGRIGIEPAYLSKIERGEVAPPSEVTTAALAKESGEDVDVLLALGEGSPPTFRKSFASDLVSSRIGSAN